MNDIDTLLNSYQPGRPENKPDVTKQIESLTKTRQEMENQLQHMHQQMQQQMQQQMHQQTQQIKTQYETRLAQLTAENLTLKDKTEYLTKKISGIIQAQIEQKKAFDEAWVLTPRNKTAEMSAK